MNTLLSLLFSTEFLPRAKKKYIEKYIAKNHLELFPNYNFFFDETPESQI